MHAACPAHFILSPSITNYLQMAAHIYITARRTLQIWSWQSQLKISQNVYMSGICNLLQVVFYEQGSQEVKTTKTHHRDAVHVGALTCKDAVRTENPAFRRLFLISESFFY